MMYGLAVLVLVLGPHLGSTVRSSGDTDGTRDGAKDLGVDKEGEQGGWGALVQYMEESGSFANSSTPPTAKWTYADTTITLGRWSNSVTEQEMLSRLAARKGKDASRGVRIKLETFDGFDGGEVRCAPGDGQAQCVRDAYASIPRHYAMGRSFSYLGSLKHMISDGYGATLEAASKDGGVTATGVFDSTWYLKYDDIERRLTEMPQKFHSKEIVKGNDLGEFILNPKLWKHDPYMKAIALGMAPEEHAWGRPILDAIWGPGGTAWNDDVIEGFMTEFFQGRTTIDTKADPYVLMAKIMFKVTLDLDISDTEATEFAEWQGNLPMLIVLPEGMVSGFGGKLLNGALFSMTPSMIRQKYAAYMDTFKSRIREIYFNPALSRTHPFRRLFEEHNVPADDRSFHTLAHGFLDAMAFAGGLSVPGMMKVGLAVLKSSESIFPSDQRGLDNEGDVDKFVWEVVRRYPPVVAFSYWNADETARTVLALGMALRDSDKWTAVARSRGLGEDQAADLMGFKLRDLGLYKQLAKVAWAGQSDGTDPSTKPYSRGCPGGSLSVVVATKFFEAWRETQASWSITAPAEKPVEFQDYAPWVKADFTLTKVASTA